MNSKLSIRRLAVCVSFLAALTVISGCFPEVQASAERSQIFTVSGKPTLNISGNDIDVTIRSDPGTEQIRVHATLYAWGATERDAKRNVNAINLSMTQSGDEIRVRHISTRQISFGIHFGDRIHLDILMPTEGDFELSTDDGDVDITGISGTFNIRTDDGEIALRDVTGTFDLYSDDGDIWIRNGTGTLFADSDDGDITFEGRLQSPRHEIRSDNGDVEIIIPSDSRLHIDVTTDDGSIRASIPSTVEIREEHHWSATLNGPDSTLTIQTDDGDISIRELRE